jgi:Tol biopolymer transport system component
MHRLIVKSVLAGLMALAAASAAPAAANPPHANGQIVFARFDPLLEDTVIHTVNPDGSHERQVLPLPAECPRWTPDGTRITTCGFPPHNATAIINPDDGSYRALPMPDPDNLFTACLLMSPDATRLACEGFGEDLVGNPTDPSLNGIYTIRSSDGRDLTRMTSNPGGGDLPGDYSPNGKRLVFGRFDHPSDPDGLYTVKTNGTGLRQITPTGTILRAESSGSWSPQGNKILFARRLAADRRTTLWVVNTDGSGLNQIDVQVQPACGGPIAEPGSRSCFYPRWSPDGTKIAFSIFSDATGDNVYTANSDGTHVTQVTHGGEDDSPDWGTHPLAR